MNLALNGAKDLIPEATDALVEVLCERNYDKKIIDNIKKQRLDFAVEDIVDIEKKFSKGICPRCNKNGSINALAMTKVTGAVVITRFNYELIIGCKDCISKEVKKTISHNLLAGWGSFSGFIRTPINVISLLIKHSMLNNDFNTISKDYDEFLRNNIGYILNHIDE